MLVVIIAAPAAASGQIAVDQFANIGGSGSIANGLFQPRNVSNNDTGNHKPKSYTWSFLSTRFTGTTKGYSTNPF